jgi:UDP-N-acetylmuramoyl-tripeptide--D-alanyl-D-alanine ligase
VIKLDFSALAHMTGGILADEKFGGAVFSGVSIDSRTAKADQLFIAVRGDRTDGHLYIDNALNKKIAGLMIEKSYPDSNKFDGKLPVVLVDDSHSSLKTLASKYAEKMDGQYIAVTGSNGKTTTKEFIYGMLKATGRSVYRSPGNLNNLYGLPLAIFGMPQNTELAVFEYGISTPGEMTELTRILIPSAAVVTNIGPTHLETLNSVEGVAEAKLELADRMDKSSPFLINADDPVLTAAAGRRDRSFITFGIERKADFRAQRAGIDREGFPVMKIDGHLIRLPLFGTHQIYNALAAYAMVKILDLDEQIESFENIVYDFAPYRGEIEYVNDLTMIIDCYNANPVSMESGLKSFYDYCHSRVDSTGGSFVVIGDMLELGNESKAHHGRIGEILAALNFDYVLVVGGESEETYRAAINAGYDKDKIDYFGDTADAGEALLENIQRGDMIFFKASRGIALEKLVTLLKGSAFRQN